MESPQQMVAKNDESVVIANANNTDLGAAAPGVTDSEPMPAEHHRCRPSGSSFASQPAR